MNDYFLGYDPHNSDIGQCSDTVNIGSNGPHLPSDSECRSCGACVAHCPTYQIKAEENQSPRGRVRLIDKALHGSLPLSSEEKTSLRQCTLCRACETVCPSKMAYGESYAMALKRINESAAPQPSLVIRLLRNHLSIKPWLQVITRVAIACYKKSGAQRLARGNNLLQGEFKRLDPLLAETHRVRPLRAHYDSLTEARYGKVALFTGCLSSFLDNQFHHATIKVLTRLGYEVAVPKTQTCCGAMHHHCGDKDMAITLAKKNLDVFEATRVSAILHSTSGCGAFISEYAQLLSHGAVDKKPKLIRRGMDIITFLDNIHWHIQPTFRFAHIKVAVHEPCSQRNLLKSQESTYRILKRIPGLEVIPLPENRLCCGAGGIKMITDPEIADPLRDRKVEFLLQSGAEILLSSNMSCALHLANGVRAAGGDIEVLHPIQLLARQLI